MSQLMLELQTQSYAVEVSKITWNMTTLVHPGTCVTQCSSSLASSTIWTLCSWSSPCNAVLCDEQLLHHFTTVAVGRFGGEKGQAYLCEAGNGGLSLRKKSVMLRQIRNQLRSLVMEDYQVCRGCSSPRHWQKKVLSSLLRLPRS